MNDAKKKKTDYEFRKWQHPQIILKTDYETHLKIHKIAFIEH